MLAHAPRGLLTFLLAAPLAPALGSVLQVLCVTRQPLGMGRARSTGAAILAKLAWAVCGYLLLPVWPAQTSIAPVIAGLLAVILLDIAAFWTMGAPRQLGRLMVTIVVIDAAWFVLLIGGLFLIVSA